MGVVDTVILFAYLALLVGIGIYAQRRKPDVDDYFVAGRRMGPVDDRLHVGRGLDRRSLDRRHVGPRLRAGHHRHLVRHRDRDRLPACSASRSRSA